MKWISQFFFHATLILLCFVSFFSHLNASESTFWLLLEIVVVFCINDFHFIRLWEEIVRRMLYTSLGDFVWFDLVVFVFFYLVCLGRFLLQLLVLLLLLEWDKMLARYYINTSAQLGASVRHIFLSIFAIFLNAIAFYAHQKQSQTDIIS